MTNTKKASIPNMQPSQSQSQSHSQPQKASPAPAPKKSESPSPSSSSSQSLSQAFTSSASDSETAVFTELLEELDLFGYTEKKSSAPSTTPVYNTAAPSLGKTFSKEKLSKAGERLLGIIGPCQLKGHIAHFYNLSFEIEKHIKTVEELGDVRFIQAYEVLASNPDIEAVFVYESKMTAAGRVNGRTFKRDIF